jgi:flagellar biosynthesis chaperone FliJ
MKKFKFRLEKVLGYRARICDEKRQELVRRNFERDQALRQLEELRRQFRELQYPGSGTDPALGIPNAEPLVSSQVFIMVGSYAGRLESEIEQQLVRVEEAMEAASRARDVYIEASKDVKALETLKEKRQADYNDMKLKDDERTLDELTVQRFKRP